jgi:hypothetical protein
MTYNTASALYMYTACWVIKFVFIVTFEILRDFLPFCASFTRRLMVPSAPLACQNVFRYNFCIFRGENRVKFFLPRRGAAVGFENDSATF